MNRLFININFLDISCRDDPITIKLRFASVTFTCVFASLLVWFLVPPKNNEKLCQQLGSCILQIDPLQVIVIPLLISCVLFMGPLVVLFDTYTWSEFKVHIVEELCPMDLMFLRNYVVAPFSEEFIFRAVMVCIMKEMSHNSWFIVITTSLIFSFAHSHHYIFQKVQDITLSLYDWLFQMMYTFVFGCICCAFYLKTGSFLTPVVLHVFCNFMGFPDVDTLYSKTRYWRFAITGVVSWFAIIPYYLLN